MAPRTIRDDHETDLSYAKGTLGTVPSAASGVKCVLERRAGH